MRKVTKAVLHAKDEQEESEAEEELAKVLPEIRKAAKNGDFSVTVDSYLGKKAMEKLAKAEYAVKDKSYTLSAMEGGGRFHSYFITWGDPDEENDWEN